MRLTKVVLSLAAILVLTVSAQAALAGGIGKQSLVLDQTAAGAAIAAEGDSVRLGGDVQALEVSMEAIDDATGKDAVGNGSTFEVFVTFSANGQISRISAGQIVMRAGHADLVLSADPLEKGCMPEACGFMPAGFLSVESISRIEVVAVSVLDPNTDLPMPALAGQVVLDSGANSWATK